MLLKPATFSSTSVWLFGDGIVSGICMDMCLVEKNIISINL